MTLVVSPGIRRVGFVGGIAGLEALYRTAQRWLWINAGDRGRAAHQLVTERKEDTEKDSETRQ
jgi:hypothetical protein